MKLSKGLNIALVGERFVQKMSGFDFNNAAQIIVVLYPSYPENAPAVKSWVKVADPENYPDAGVIDFDPADGKTFFEVDTTGLEISTYSIEVRVDFAGLENPIDKESKEYLKIKPSKTTTP